MKLTKDDRRFIAVCCVIGTVAGFASAALRHFAGS